MSHRKNQPIQVRGNFEPQYHNTTALHPIDQQIPVKSGNTEHVINQTTQQPDYYRATADHSDEQYLSNRNGTNLLPSLTNQVANSNIHQTSYNYSPVFHFGNQFFPEWLLNHPQANKINPVILPVSVPACFVNGSGHEHSSFYGYDAGDDIHTNANQELEPKHRQRWVSSWDATHGSRVTQAGESDSESYYDSLDTDAHLSHPSSARFKRSSGLPLKNLKHDGAERGVQANAGARQSASVSESPSKSPRRPLRPSTLGQDTSSKGSHSHSHSYKPNLEAKADASQTGDAPGSLPNTSKPDNSGFPMHSIASKSSATKQHPSSQKKNNVPKHKSNFLPYPCASSSSTPFKPPLNLGDSENDDGYSSSFSSPAGTLSRRSTRKRIPPRNPTEESITQAATGQTLCTSTTLSGSTTLPCGRRRSVRIQEREERKRQLKQ